MPLIFVENMKKLFTAANSICSIAPKASAEATADAAVSLLYQMLFSSRSEQPDSALNLSNQPHNKPKWDLGDKNPGKEEGSVEQKDDWFFQLRTMLDCFIPELGGNVPDARETELMGQMWSKTQNQELDKLRLEKLDQRIYPPFIS